MADATYMIVVEEEHKKETERKSYENPFNIQMPEVDQPRSICCRMERLCDWQIADVCSLQVSRKVRKADPKNRAEL